jgi:DNA processing protein
MRAVAPAERLARATLARLTEPGDTAVGRLVARDGAVAVVAALREARLELGRRRVAGLLARLAELPAEGELLGADQAGGRLLCPGDAEWPECVDDLGEAAPLALWARGPLSIAAVTERAVAVVGARAATPYGSHVATELAASLAERGWCVVSGAAYGIDAAAHRGALAVGGPTIAMLACGVDVAYPRGHRALIDRIGDEGAVLSEVPPGATPTRIRFRTRNRVIAALAAGTVVVEAGRRSGSLITARHAEELSRHRMAVPGPVTSAQSAGCHQMLRDGAICVTSAAEVIEIIGCLGDDLAPDDPRDPTVRDDLDPVSERVLEAMPVRLPATAAHIAVAAGVDPQLVLRALGGLLALGLAERTPEGWRLGARAREAI